MVGGAVRGGEGGQSPTGTLEMVRSSCLLKQRKTIISKNIERNQLKEAFFTYQLS